MRKLYNTLNIFFISLFCFSLGLPQYSYAQTTSGAVEQSGNSSANSASADSGYIQGPNLQPQVTAEYTKITLGSVANEAFSGNSKTEAALVGGASALLYTGYGTVPAAIFLAVYGSIKMLNSYWKLRDKNDLAACQVNIFKSKYCGCFACSTVAVIISIFLEVAAQGSGLMKQAAQNILLIFSALWIAIFFLKQLSSFAAVELSEMVQTLGIFIFKVLVAWVCINGGFALAAYYILDPIISFGTDFGESFLDMVIPEVSSDALCGAGG